MHNQRIFIIISAIIGIIATFLPFMKSWFNSVSLIQTTDGTGYIIIAAFVISLIVALVGEHSNAMAKGHLAGSIIPGIIPGVLMILLVFSRKNDNLLEAFTNFEVGFYLVLIASFLILIFGLALKEDAPSSISNSAKEDVLFCSQCGKRFSSKTAGEYCDECGNKL